MRILRWVAGLILAAIVVIFAVSNRDMVAIRFWPLIDGVETRVFLAVLLPFAGGFLLGYLVAGTRAHLKRRAERKAAP